MIIVISSSSLGWTSCGEKLHLIVIHPIVIETFHMWAQIWTSWYHIKKSYRISNLSEFILWGSWLSVLYFVAACQDIHWLWMMLQTFGPDQSGATKNWHCHFMLLSMTKSIALMHCLTLWGVYFVLDIKFSLCHIHNGSSLFSNCIIFSLYPLHKVTVSLLSVENVLFYGLSVTFSSAVLLILDEIRREGE